MKDMESSPTIYQAIDWESSLEDYNSPSGSSSSRRYIGSDCNASTDEKLSRKRREPISINGATETFKKGQNRCKPPASSLPTVIENCHENTGDRKVKSEEVMYGDSIDKPFFTSKQWYDYNVSKSFYCDLEMKKFRYVEKNLKLMDYVYLNDDAFLSDTISQYKTDLWLEKTERELRRMFNLAFDSNPRRKQEFQLATSEQKSQNAGEFRDTDKILGGTSQAAETSGSGQRSVAKFSLGEFNDLLDHDLTPSKELTDFLNIDTHSSVLEKNPLNVEGLVQPLANSSDVITSSSRKIEQVLVQPRMEPNESQKFLQNNVPKSQINTRSSTVTQQTLESSSLISSFRLNSPSRLRKGKKWNKDESWNDSHRSSFFPKMPARTDSSSTNEGGPFSRKQSSESGSRLSRGFQNLWKGTNSLRRASNNSSRIEPPESFSSVTQIGLDNLERTLQTGDDDELLGNKSNISPLLWTPLEHENSTESSDESLNDEEKFQFDKGRGFFSAELSRPSILPKSLTASKSSDTIESSLSVTDAHPRTLRVTNPSEDNLSNFNDLENSLFSSSFIEEILPQLQFLDNSEVSLLSFNSRNHSTEKTISETIHLENDDLTRAQYSSSPESPQLDDGYLKRFGLVIEDVEDDEDDEDAETVSSPVNANASCETAKPNEQVVENISGNAKSPSQGSLLLRKVLRRNLKRNSNVNI